MIGVRWWEKLLVKSFGLPVYTNGKIGGYLYGGRIYVLTRLSR